MNSFEPEPPQTVRLSLPLVRPRLVWGVLAINVAMFVGETLLGGSENHETLITLGAKVNALIVMGQYWRLFTPMFLHIGVMHLLVNSYALYSLGPEVEAIYGRARFLAIYLVSGVAGNVSSFAFTPALSAGASTAIFGLVGTQLAFFFRQRNLLGQFGQRRLVNILGIVLINLMLGASGAVDNWGHIGGFIGGLVLGWLLCPTYEAEVGPDGLPRLVDCNSLRREALGVMLFVVLLAVATGAATLAQRDDPNLTLEQGAMAFDRGDYASALPLLEQAARALPDDAQAQFLLAGDYYNLGRYAEAAQAFERTTQAAPQLADAHFYLSLAYLHLDRYAVAVPHLRQYLTLAPTGEHAAQARQILSQFE